VPVTELGKKAEAEQDRRVANIKKEIRSSLRNGVKFNPKTLVDYYHHSLAVEVREAMWQLLDEDVIELASDRDLTLLESK